MSIFPTQMTYCAIFPRKFPYYVKRMEMQEIIRSSSGYYNDKTIVDLVPGEIFSSPSRYTTLQNLNIIILLFKCCLIISVLIDGVRTVKATEHDIIKISQRLLKGKNRNEYCPRCQAPSWAQPNINRDFQALVYYSGFQEIAHSQIVYTQPFYTEENVYHDEHKFDTIPNCYTYK